MLIPEYFIYPFALMLGIPIVCFILGGADAIKVLFGSIIGFFLYLPSIIKALLKKICNLPSILKNIRITKEKVKLTLLVVGAFLFCAWMSVYLARTWIIGKLCPYVIVVENGVDSKDVSYKVYVALGDPTIKGEKQHLSVGETMIMNNSSQKLTYESIKYANKTEAKWYYGSSSTTIEKGEAIRVDNYPDYFFTNPPSTKKSLWKTECIYVLNVAN